MKLSARFETLSLFVISLLALAAFAWPLFVPALPASSQAAIPGMILLLLPILILLAGLGLEGVVSGPKQLALLATLASLAAATRIATGGVGGFELIFVMVILGGRAFGARFGFLLGAMSIAASSLFFGGLGPWTAFQMFAVGWVGAGAGLIASRARAMDARARRREVLALGFYAFFASYVFGLIMNLWFWPFATGPTSSISYDPAADLGQNLASFFFYSLASSTLTWDSVRALTTAIVILVIGQPVLSILRRAKL